MKNLIAAVLLLGCIAPAHAQKSLSQTGHKISQGHVFLILNDDGSLTFFQDKKENQKPVEKSTLFLVKDSYTNLYFGWKNPLKYRIVWKDSVYDDERDQAVKTFVTALVGQFGSSVTGLNIDESKSKSALEAFKINEETDRKKEEADRKSRKNLTPPTEIKTPIEIRAFKSIDLTLLYLHLRASQEQLTDSERIAINKLTPKLEVLDRKITFDYKGGVDENFIKLFGITDVMQVTPGVESVNDAIKKYNEEFNEIATLQAQVTSSVNDIDLVDPLLNTYFQSALPGYLKQTESSLKEARDLVEKLKPIIEIMNSSINDKADRDGYYKARGIKFDDGKILSAKADVSVYEYDSDKKEFKQSRVVNTVKITFKKYDWITPIASAGVFYSDVEIPGFSLKNENDKFLVQNDTISRNSAVTAAFLNLNFSVNSKYFSPLLQIGMDPTKTRPYLLLGGGFTIPVVRFGLSAGPIWTFQPKLDQLKVGDVVSSEVELQNDIKYTFQAKPIGWYLGIIYNF